MTLRERNAAKVEELLREGCRLLTLEKQKSGKVNIKKTATILGVPYSTLHTHPPLTENILNLPNMSFHPDTQHSYGNFFATFHTNP